MPIDPLRPPVGSRFGELTVTDDDAPFEDGCAGILARCTCGVRVRLAPSRWGDKKTCGFELNHKVNEERGKLAHRADRALTPAELAALARVPKRRLADLAGLTKRTIQNAGNGHRLSVATIAALTRALKPYLKQAARDSGEPLPAHFGGKP